MLKARFNSFRIESFKNEWWQVLSCPFKHRDHCGEWCPACQVEEMSHYPENAAPKFRQITMKCFPQPVIYELVEGETT
jgi:hypothetical protein